MMMGLTRLSSSLRVWPMRLTDNMTLVQDKKMRGKKMTAWMYLLYKYSNISGPSCTWSRACKVDLAWLLCQHLCPHTQSGTTGPISCIESSDIGTYELSFCSFHTLLWVLNRCIYPWFRLRIWHNCQYPLQLGSYTPVCGESMIALAWEIHIV